MRLKGIGEEDLATGYLCDPASKSALRVLARPGIKVRLTRNFDKTRGFVNGATGTVCQSLYGNAVCTVKLHGTGNLVLVHPVEENGALFLPCADWAHAGCEHVVAHPRAQLQRRRGI